MKTARPCLSCQKPQTNGPRCPACTQARAQQRDQRRGTRTERGYTNDWHRVAAQAIAEQPWCTNCGHSGSPDNPLTGDHILPKSKGGQPVRENVRVLCRRCNSRRGDRT